jgi:hypothetical protein
MEQTAGDVRARREIDDDAKRIDPTAHADASAPPIACSTRSWSQHLQPRSQHAARNSTPSSLRAASSTDRNGTTVQPPTTTLSGARSAIESAFMIDGDAHTSDEFAERQRMQWSAKPPPHPETITRVLKESA